jgi:hypothetical protein
LSTKICIILNKKAKYYFEVLQRKNCVLKFCIPHLPLPPPKGDIPLWRGQGEVEFGLLQKTISIYCMI